MSEDEPIIYGVGSASMFSHYQTRRKKKPIGFAPPPPSEPKKRKRK